MPFGNPNGWAKRSSTIQTRSPFTRYSRNLAEWLCSPQTSCTEAVSLHANAWQPGVALRSSFLIKINKLMRIRKSYPPCPDRSEGRGTQQPLPAGDGLNEDKAMDLTCYLIDDHPVDIRPALNRRKWMDQTPDSYA